MASFCSLNNAQAITEYFISFSKYIHLHSPCPQDSTAMTNICHASIEQDLLVACIKPPIIL